MRTDYVRLGADQTVAEALESARHQNTAGRIIYFYVLGPDDQRLGVVPTRRLLLNSPDTRIDAIMVSQVIAVPKEATVLEACELFSQYRLLAVPVVDNGRMLGVVDVEVYTKEWADLDRSQEGND